MNTVEELCAASDLISARTRHIVSPGFVATLDRLHDAAEAVGMAWCGSWLPGLANLYQAQLEPGEPGNGPSCSRCVPWSPSAIQEAICERAGSPDIGALLAEAAQAALLFEHAIADGLGLMVAAACEHGVDAKLTALAKQAGELRLLDPEMAVAELRPAVTLAWHGRGAPAWQQEVPPHIAELAAIHALRSPLVGLNTLARLLQAAADHLSAVAPANDDSLPPWPSRPSADADAEAERWGRGARG